MAEPALRIGEVAAESGVSIDTVRYYERRQLLPTAARTNGGFRLFTREAVERVRFIKQAQDVGFSLDEIGELLIPGDAAKCRQVRDLLRAKLTELEQRMRLMRRFHATLTNHFSACERALRQDAQTTECPVIVKIGQIDSAPRSGRHQSQRKHRNGKAPATKRRRLH